MWTRICQSSHLNQPQMWKNPVKISKVDSKLTIVTKASPGKTRRIIHLIPAKLSTYRIVTKRNSFRPLNFGGTSLLHSTSWPMQRLNTKRAISLPFIEILGALGFMEPVSQQAETGKDGSGCQQRYKVVSILNSNRSSQSRKKVEETGAYGII